MILYGTKSKSITGPVLQNTQALTCPHCGQDKFSSFGVFSYKHVYYIPIFPYGRKAGLECLHCKFTFLDKEVPEELRKDICQTIFKKKKTLPMYSGVLVIAALLGLGFYVHQIKEQEKAAYVAAPHINDLYIVKINEIFQSEDNGREYGLLRLVDISPSRLTFLVGNLVYNKARGVQRDIDNEAYRQESYYAKQTLTMSPADLGALKEKDIIYSVTRIS